MDERPANNPEIAYTQKETSEMVQELLESLSPEQKMAIMMFHFEGHSISEIAKTMECNENTVKSRLNLGRKKLKESCKNLQKKGYRLYSFSPVMLLLFLLKGEEANAAAALGAAMQQGAATVLGKPSNDAGKPSNDAGNPSAKGTGKKGPMKQAGNLAKGKTGLLASAGVKAAMAIAVVAGVAVVINSQLDKEPEKESGHSKTHREEQVQESSAIMEDFGSIEPGAVSHVNEVLGFDTTEYEGILTRYESEIKAYDWQGYGEDDDRQIAFADLNHDGIPEMFVMRIDTLSPDSPVMDPDKTAFLEIYSTDAEGKCVKYEYDRQKWINARMRNYLLVQSNTGEVYLIEDKTANGGTKGQRCAITDHWQITLSEGKACLEEYLHWQNDYQEGSRIDNISTRIALENRSFEEYRDRKKEWELSVDRVLMGAKSDRYDYFVNCGAKDLSMNWDEAREYLATGLLPEKVTSVLRDYLTLEDEEVYARGRNGIRFSHGKMYIVVAPYEEETTIKEITKVDAFTYSISYSYDDRDLELILYLPGKDITEIPAEYMAKLEHFDRDLWSWGFPFDLTGNRLHGYMALYDNIYDIRCYMSCPF